MAAGAAAWTRHHRCLSDAGGRKPRGQRGAAQPWQLRLTTWPPQGPTPHLHSHVTGLDFVWSLLAARENGNSGLLVCWIAAYIQTVSVFKQGENENYGNNQRALPTRNSKMKSRRRLIFGGTGHLFTYHSLTCLGVFHSQTEQKALVPNQDIWVGLLLLVPRKIIKTTLLAHLLITCK